MTGRVLVVGSLNVDLIINLDRHPGPGETVVARGSVRSAGGKGANQAVAAAVAGAEVSMAGWVGADDDGRAYRDRLHRFGIDTTDVGVHPSERTGSAIVALDEQGENIITVLPGANRGGSWPRGLAAMLDALDPGDVVLLQLEIDLVQVAEVVLAARDRDLQVLLNIAPYADLDPDVLAATDVVIANEHEALLLADSGGFPPSLLVTLGAAGASWDGEHRTGPIVPAGQVIDTTGAGDAFCGALAAALAAGESREDALDRALAAGALAVRRLGAQPDPPGFSAWN